MKTMFKHYFKPMVSFGFFLSILLITQATWAQTWNGSTGDKNWNNPLNWTPNVVPSNVAVTFTSANAFVTVPAGNFTVTTLSLTNNTQLSLADGANLTIISLDVDATSNLLLDESALATSVGSRLNVRGDIQLANANGLTMRSSLSQVRFTGEGPAKQLVRINAGGTLNLARIAMANTAAGTGISLAANPNLTNLTIQTRAPLGNPGTAMVTAISFEGTTRAMNSISMSEASHLFTLQNGIAGEAFISVPSVGAHIEGEGQILVNSALGNFVFTDKGQLPTAEWGELLVDRANLTIQSGRFDLGYHRLLLGGSLTNSSEPNALGLSGYLTLNHPSRNQIISGGIGNTPLNLAQLRLDKGGNGEIELRTTVRFTTTSVFNTVSLEFVSGNPLLRLTGSDGNTLTGATAPPTGSLHFATTGQMFISAGTGKIIGDGSIFIQRHAGAPADPNALITVFITSNPGAETFVRMENLNLIVAEGNDEGRHTLDLGSSRLQLGANLRYNGFITTSSGLGTIEFISSRNQVVTNTLANATSQAKEYSFPPIIVNKTANNVEFRRGENNTGKASYSIIGNGTNSDPNANVIRFASANVGFLDLGANVFLTVRAQGTLSAFNTAVSNGFATAGTVASNAIRGAAGSGVDFVTSNSLVSNFAILTPQVAFATANLNIASHKLVIGGNLTTTSNSFNAAYITATDFNSAGVILNGQTALGVGNAQFITAFITGLPNVVISNADVVTLQGNLNAYSSPTALANITALNLVAGNLEINSKFLTISGYSPVVNVTGGNFRNTLPAGTSRGTVFVSGLAGTFMTVGTTAADINFGDRVNVQVGNNSGISFNSATTKSITFQADLINEAGIQTIFATTNNVDQKVVFAGANFATVFNTVVFPRLQVNKSGATDITTNARCGGTLGLGNAALTLTHFVTIAANTGTVLELGTSRSAIFISGTNSGIDLRNDGGDITLVAGSFITGAGFVSVNGFKTVKSGDLVSYANLAIATDKGLTLAGVSRLSVGGDLMGGMIDGTGAVRFIGGLFQTVTIGSLPGIIVDKCPTGPFMTVMQSTTANSSLVLGRSGLTVESGVFVINNPVFTSGNVIVRADLTPGPNFITSFNTANAVLVFNTVTNAGAPLQLTKEGTNAFISIPALRTQQGGEVQLGNNLSLYGGSDAGFYTALAMTSGSIALNGKNVWFNGGPALAFQTNNAVFTGTGDVYITASATNLALSTVIFMTTNLGTPFVIPNNLHINAGAVALNGTNLRLGGNLFNNNTFTEAFSTISGAAFPYVAGGAAAFGQVQMMGANATIGGTAPGISMPGLFVNTRATLAMGAANSSPLNLTNAHSGTGIGNVNNFATVLEFGNGATLDLNNRFLSVNTLGVIKASTCTNGGNITGGVTSGSIRLQGRTDLGAPNNIYITGTVNIPTSGVVVNASAQFNPNANNETYIAWDNRYIYDLRVGGDFNRLGTNNNVTTFRDPTGAGDQAFSPRVEASVTAGQHSKITFTGNTFASVNVFILPNIEIQKGANAGVYFSNPGNHVLLVGLGTGQASCGGNIDAFSINGAGNAVLANAFDLVVLTRTTGYNGATLSQQGGGFITGGSGSKFSISAATQNSGAASSFYTVVSPTFVVRVPTTEFVAGFDRRLHLVGARDLTGTGATLTLGGNLVNNATNANADIFGGSYAASPDGTVQTIAAHLYPGYNGALVFFSAVTPAQNQTVSNLTRFPRLQATGFNGGFSTVSSATAHNLVINGNGGNNVLSLNNSVLYLNQNSQLLQVYNSTTPGIFVQTNGGFISTTAFDPGAAGAANNNLDRNAVQFFQDTKLGSDFWFDETSVVLGGGASVGTKLNLDTYTLNLGGSVFGNNGIAANNNTGFTGTGLLRFTSTDNNALAQRYMFGVGQVPAMDVAAPFATVYLTESLASSMRVTGSNRNVLTFTSGFMQLGRAAEGNEGLLLVIDGASSGIYGNTPANHEQPMLTTGTIRFTGTGRSTIGHSDFMTVGQMNDIIRRGLRLPRVHILKSDGDLFLSGNVFITTNFNSPDYEELRVLQGNLDLDGNYLQLLNNITMRENIATPAVIKDSNAGGGALNDNRQGRGVTGAVFATAVTITPTGGTNLAGMNLVVKNGDGGGNVVVDLARRHNWGDDNADMITAVIKRNYAFMTVRPGLGASTFTNGNASVQINYANTERFDATTIDMPVVAFTTTPSAIDEQYTALGGSGVANSAAWNNAVLTNTAFTTGYITLGGSLINMITASQTEVGLGAWVAQEATPVTNVTSAYFKFVHPAISGTATVGLELFDANPGTVAAPRRRAQYGSDFTFVSTGVTAGASANFFTVTIQPGTYATFITINVIDDELAEGLEYITANFTNVISGSLAPGTFRTANITINDNDVPGFILSPVTTSVGSGANFTGAFTQTGTQATGARQFDLATGFVTTSETVQDAFGGNRALVAVRLNRRPSGDVTLYVESSNTTEFKVGAVNPAGSVIGVPAAPFLGYALTFTPSNWNVFQTAAVVGQDDLSFDSGIGTSTSSFLSVYVGTATAPEYLTPQLKGVGLEVRNNDNEEQAYVVIENNAALTGNTVPNMLEDFTPLNQLQPAGATFNTVTFSLRLNVQPLGTQNAILDFNSVGFVTANQARIGITGGNVAGRPGVVSFNNANWNIPVFVTVSAVANDIDDDNADTFISAFISTSGGLSINPSFGVSLGTSTATPTLLLTRSFIPFRVLDNDNAGYQSNINAVAPTNGAFFELTDRLDERGKRVSGVNYRLRTQPTANVSLTVNVRSITAVGTFSNGAGLSTDGVAFTTSVTLTFTPANWNVVQNITIQGVDNNLNDGIRTVLIQTNNWVSTDAKYNGVSVEDYVAYIGDNGSNSGAGAGTGTGTGDGSSGTGTSNLTPPSGVTVKAGNRSVVVTWAPNPETNVMYEVCYFAAGVAERCVTTTSTSATINGLQNGITYRFRVRALSATEGTRNPSQFTAAVEAYPSIVLANGEEDIKSNLNVYPNPSDGSFTLKLSNVNTSRMKVSVTDVTGRQIFTKDFGKTAGEFQADLMMANMPAGIYMLSVDTDNGTYHTRLMLVKNR